MISEKQNQLLIHKGKKMNWTSSKKRTYTRVSFQSKYQPEQLWEILIHPKYAEELAIEKCFYIEIPNDFSLEKGKKYIEIHNGEHCRGESCEYQIVQCEPYQLYRKVKHQSGLKEITSHILTPNKNGTLITELHQYSISFKEFKLKNLLTWLFLHLGILTKFINLEEDIQWFKNVENLIKNKSQKD